MDKYTGKRAVVGIGIAARESGLASRDTSHNENRSGQCCNRLGCSTRLNSMKGTHIGNSEKVNKPGLSVRSRSGSSMVGSSSKTYSAINEVKKPNLECQKPSFHKDEVSAEPSKIQMEREVSDPSPSNSKPVDAKSGDLNGFSVDTSEEVGTSNESSNTRMQKTASHKRSVLGNQDLSPNSSSRRSFAPRNTIQTVKPISHGQGNSSRYALKNLGCASISDVLPGCPSSDSSRSRRTELAKRKSSEGGYRGKMVSGSSSGGNSGNQRNTSSSSSLSLSERPSSQQYSRRTRNLPPSRDGVTSVRTRRTTNGETRARLSENGDGNNFSESDPPVIISELSHTELSVGQSSQHGSSQQSPLLPIAHRNSYERPGSSNGGARSRPASHPEDDGLRLFNGLSIERDGFRRFNMDGIAEVLLALDRIEHDEELTYEQLMALEANLFLGGISFHDQHRDMRLDIDNMSYEELLALEEKMGNVSTALTEEAISKCLKRCCYMPAPLDGKSVDSGDDDVKCSVCQEEYVEGDEVGKLRCDHRYHVVCVQQWLRQKNWCPICKAPATDS